jgi:hypothetical protein
MSLHSSALSLFRVNKSMYFLFKFSRGALFTSPIVQFLVLIDRGSNKQFTVIDGSDHYITETVHKQFVFAQIASVQQYFVQNI